ncbi:hypothetical protein HY065_02015 [Candidatus Berkelbacteria bacterium]|nr:hypothetical protein [Candidatus Berkelbacteria bacterium]
MNKKFTTFLIGSLVVIFAVALVLVPHHAFAQKLGDILPGGGAAGSKPYGDFPSNFTSVKTIFSVAIAAAAVVFMVLLLVGGVQYLVSAGNEEATGKAKKLLVDAVIGLIITLSAWAVGVFILGRFFGFAGGIGAGGGGGGPSTPRTPPTGPPDTSGGGSTSIVHGEIIITEANGTARTISDATYAEFTNQCRSISAPVNGNDCVATSGASAQFVPKS